MKARLARIESRSKRSGSHCLIFEGRDGHPVPINNRGQGYHIIRLSIPGYESKTMILARAVFILRHHRLDLYPGRTGGSEWHVSHLCHHPLCIAEQHLVLEPQDINKNRMLCYHLGRCQGHDGYPDCIIISPDKSA